MKGLNYSTLISSLIIGISVVAASFVLQGSEGSTPLPAVTNEADWVQSDSPLMTLEQTAEFLNLTEYQVKTIISSDNALRDQGAASGMPFPYIVVQNEIYVSKTGLISWLQEAALEQREFQ